MLHTHSPIVDGHLDVFLAVVRCDSGVAVTQVNFLAVSTWNTERHVSCQQSFILHLLDTHKTYQHMGEKLLIADSTVTQSPNGEQFTATIAIATTVKDGEHQLRSGGLNCQCRCQCTRKFLTYRHYEKAV